MKIKVFHDSYGKITYENVRRFHTQNNEYHIVKRDTEITLKQRGIGNFEIKQQTIDKELIPKDILEQ